MEHTVHIVFQQSQTHITEHSRKATKKVQDNHLGYLVRQSAECVLWCSWTLRTNSGCSALHSLLLERLNLVVVGAHVEVAVAGL